MKSLCIALFILLGCYAGYAYERESLVLPSATISGNATVCQNATGVVITFTGSNGSGNYTFNYKLNGLLQTPVVTTGGNSTVSVPVNTSATGTFTYNLISVQDASGTTTLNLNAVITVISNFTVNAGVDILVCKGNSINLTSSVTGNGSNPVIYSWTGPNGFTSNQQSPTIASSSIAMTGNYTVTASVGSCQVQDVVNVQVINVGVTNPTTLNACLTTGQTNAQVGLILSLPVNPSVIQSITINWGDLSAPQVIPQSNWTTPIVYTYSPGSYTVTITATTTLGCNVTQTYIAFVGSSPQAATLSLFANQASGCSPHTTNFTFGVPISNSDGTNYLICFGDSTSSCINYVDGAPIPSDWVYSGTAAGFNLYTITHIYNITSCGNSVNLNGTTYLNVFLPSVITTNPCTAPQPQAGSLISVGLSPTASFTPNPIPNTCVNTPLTLNNTSNFGGSIDPITYACTPTSPFYWTISPSTAGLWTATGIGSNNGFPNNELFWVTGSMNPTITFIQPGNYTITLFVKNSCGISSISHNVCVEPPLTPLFTLNSTSGCAPMAVNATNTTNVTNSCTSPTYLWHVTYAPANCGTSTTAIPDLTTANASYNFTEPGTYTISLTVTNSCGSFTSSQIVTVKKPPTVSLATISNACGSASITPNATVNACAPAGGTLTYAWSFPGGTPSSSSVVTPGPITYPAGGPYTVSLVVTNECGPSNTATQTFTVNTSPVITNTTLSQTICSGSATSLVTLTATPAGTTFSWTAIATVGVSGFLTSGTSTIPVQTITTTSSSPGTVTYIITPTVGGCVGTAVNYVVTVNPAPTITTQPVSSSVCLGGSPTPLTLALNSSAVTPSYQWYSNINNNTTGGTLITGATNATYTPPATANGTLYYYCVITLSSGGCSSLTSAVAAVTVNALPAITTQPLSTQNICVGGSIPGLTVAYSGGLGTATYQWYSNTNASTTGGTMVGTNSASYTPPAFTTAGTYYYYVVISLSGNGCGTVSSASAEIIVVSDPTVTTQPLATQTLCQNATAAVLTVAATGGIGTYLYQWYSNTTASTTGATLIPGAVTATYTPPTTAVGTKYYFCIIGQAAVGCSVTSSFAEVIVNASPTIQNQPVSSTVCIGGVPTVLSLTYTNGVGTPTYQWYSNTTNANTGGTLLAGETNPTFAPPAASVGTVYYYCMISFPALTGSCATVSTDVATVTIDAGAVITQQPLPNQSLCVGASIPSPLTVAFSGGTGTASYQWYSNINNTTVGGTAVGSNSASYTPPVFNTIGTYYYYVVITLNGSGCGNVISQVAQITIVSDPIVTTQPLATQTQCQSSASSPLVVVASGGIGTYTYQWYSNGTSSNIGGNIIAGATTDTYLPPTSTVGTIYYYCVVSQSGVGCDVVSAVSAVVVVPAPIITTQPQSAIVCAGSTLTPLSIAYSNGTGTASYQWYDDNGAIAGATSATYTPTTTVTNNFYCIITFSSGGCTNITSNTATITINPIPVISQQPTPSQSVCVGGGIGPLLVTYTGGVGTASYQWYSNNSNSTTGGTAVGTNAASYTPPAYTVAGTYYYYVVISFSSGGCGTVTSSIAQVDVVSDPTVTVQPLATQTVCQNSPATVLSLTASGGIGTTYGYQWYSSAVNSTTSGTLIPGETNSTYTPPTALAGTVYYYCLITQPNGSGCNATSAVAAVIVNLAPAVVTQPLSSTICLGSTPTVLTFTYANGAGTPNYQWYSNTSNTNVGGTLISGATGPTYNPPATSAGTIYYYCEVSFPTILGSCALIVTNTAEVTINQYPVIAAESTVICSNNAFTVTPSTASGNIIPSGTTYTWTAPNVTPTGAITGALAETVPQSSISQTLVNTTTSPATVTYTVTPLAGSCPGTSFLITVTVNPSINPNVVVTNNSCFGVNTASITTNITGGIPFNTGSPYQLSWTGPNSYTSSATSISSLLPGTYNVTIMDAGGCPFNNSYTITEPADIVINTDNETDVSCYSANNGSIAISVTGGTGAYSYSWTRNSAPYAVTEDITNLSPGTYVVTVTDANLCGPKTAIFTITEPPLLVVSLVSQTNVLCYGAATGAINASVVGGTPNPLSLDYIYSWTGPNGYTATTQNISNLFAGTYVLTVTDFNGCIKTLTVTITQSTAITIAYTTTPITCYGANNASLSTTITGGNPPYTFQWNNLSTSLTQSNLSAGSYIITVTDNVGCIKTETIVIPEAPIFTVNPIVTQVSCFGAHNGSINMNLIGGISPVALTWSDGSTAGLIRNNLGPGVYTATISDGTPCYITRTFTIVEPQPLALSANLTNAFDCTNASSGAVDLVVAGGTMPYTYSWTNGALFEDLVNITSGTYAVTVTDANGCNAAASYTIVRQDPIAITVSIQSFYDCSAHTVDQNFVAQVSGGIPPYQLQWSSGTISGANNEIMHTNTNGTVLLTVTDSNNCTATYTVTVDTPILGYPSFTTSSYGFTTYGLYAVGDPIQFNSTLTGDYVSVSWDFGDGTFSTEINPIHTYVLPKDYVVTQTVTYPFGCVYVQKITLIVEKGYVLVVPTAFTPNNDTVNDTYRPVTKGLKNIVLDIYDTWGSLIYSEKGDVLVGWDGKINGFGAENGNYYSKVSAETFYGVIVNSNQTFVLIK
jgi:gliding motility-associated-like protein